MTRPARARLVARLLKSCREESGYKSARAFYDCAGGHTALRCSYETYRRLEETDRLPKPATFERLYEGLEGSCEPVRLRTLARAYAEALLGEDLAQWPSLKTRSRRSGRSTLRAEFPDEVHNEIWDNPRSLATAVALARGRTPSGSLSGSAVKARRAFPTAKTWAPTARERDNLINRIFSASEESGEIVGGATVFVHANQDDMEEFFRHMRRTAAAYLRETRRESKRDGDVYLLELRVCERVPAPTGS